MIKALQGLKAFFKINIIKNCYIILFLFFLSNYSFAKIENKYFPEIIDNKSDFCKKHNKNFTNHKILLEHLNFIRIEVNDQNKWYKNLFRAITWHGINTPERFKNNYKSKIIINFKEDMECKFNARIRIHGDGKDHQKFSINGDPYTSLHVRLTDENIDSITRFILFIPETRNGDNEIFTSELFNQLGFLAPRTKYVKAIVNGKENKYIFQEKVSKEMLEFNNLTEGPIIEASHRFLWPNDKTNYIDTTLIQGRISNQNWAIKNLFNIKKTTMALTKFNETILEESSTHFNINNLVDQDEKSKKEFNEYQALLISLGGFHGIWPTNAKYYFDPIDLTFRPIYYDGNTEILNKDSDKNFYSRDIEYFTIYSKEGSKSSIRKVENLNIADFQKKLKENGLNISLELLSNVKEKIIERLKEINKMPISQRQFVAKKSYYSTYKNGNENKKIVFLDDDPSNIKICNFDLIECKNERLSLDEISKLFSDELSKEDVHYIFVSNDLENYRNGFIFNSRDILNKFFEKIFIDDTEILYSSGIKINLDENLKKIHFIQTNNEQVVLFKGGNIKNWTIKFEGKENFYETDNFYSGCINFSNIKITNINLIIDNASCNDAVNFINSYGDIKKLNINFSKVDAIDLDFSILEIKDINVSDALNDCLDMSYGNYVVNILKLANCGDKAISVGENSLFVGKDISIENALVGVATKDSSISNIDTIYIDNSKLCAAAYRKKQEFYGASININNLNCDTKTIYFQDGSDINIANEL